MRSTPPSARADLFRTIYFHRTVRAIDLTLADLFAESRDYLFSQSPLDDLEGYLAFTESSLLVDVARWVHSPDDRLRELGRRWQGLLRREVSWKMVCQRSLVFDESSGERSSVFSNPEWVELLEVSDDHALHASVKSGALLDWVRDVAGRAVR